MVKKIISIDRDNSSSFYATLDLPASKARAYAVFAHCFDGLQSDARLAIVSELVRHSIGVLSVDITLQSGQAATAEPNPLSPSDLKLACNYLTDNYFTPQLFIGHSFASFAILPLATSIASTRAIVSISTPSTNNISSQSQASDLFSEGLATVNIEKETLNLHSDLLKQIQASDTENLLQVNGTPLLLLHSPDDTVFDYKKLQAQVQSTQSLKKTEMPSSLVAIDKGDHAISSLLAASFCATLISSWSSYFLFANKEPNIHSIFETRNGSEQEIVAVSESKKNIYQQKVSIGDHHFFSDQSLANGGSNTGPDSTQLLLSAIGASTSQTIRDYAQLKDWPLNHISIELRLVRSRHNPESAIPSSEYVILEIELSGTLDNIQRNTLVEVAEKCELHNLLDTKILTRLKPAV